MPELPDLVHLVKVLAPALRGRRIVAGGRARADRAARAHPWRLVRRGRSKAGRSPAVERHGPFVRFAPRRRARADRPPHAHGHGCSSRRPRDRPLAHLCFSLDLDDGVEPPLRRRKAHGQGVPGARGRARGHPRVAGAGHRHPVARLHARGVRAAHRGPARPGPGLRDGPVGAERHWQRLRRRGTLRRRHPPEDTLLPARRQNDAGGSSTRSAA